MERKSKDLLEWMILVILIILSISYASWFNYMAGCALYRYNTNDVTIEQIKVGKEEAKVEVLPTEIKPEPCIMSIPPTNMTTIPESAVSKEYHEAIIREHNSKLNVILKSLMVLKTETDIMITDAESMNLELLRLKELIK